MTKTVSIQKAQASRRNGRRSRGPRSPMGKRISRWNALQHGLLASEVVIPAGEGKERRAKYAALLARLCQDLRPANALEEVLVENIAVCYWRLRRPLRCETGEIRKGLDNASMHADVETVRRFDVTKQFAPVSASAKRKLLESTLGLQHLIRLLYRVLAEVDRTGEISTETHLELLKNFGDGEDGLASLCSRLNAPLAFNKAEAELLNTKGQKGALLHVLEQEKARLESLLPAAARKDKLEQQSYAASRSLPAKDATQRIVRYAASIERELHRSIQQLTRLQKLRKQA
jgi:hypothetical protein